MKRERKVRLMLVAGTPGFVRAFLRDQIQLLVDDGFEVLLVCPPGLQAGEVACAVESLAIARVIDPLGDVKSLLALAGLMRRWQPDAVHSHSPKAGLLASVAARLCGVPVRLHTIHGLRSEGLQGLKGQVVRVMERLTASCCTRCFAVSKSLRHAVIEQGLCAAEKVVVLGSGSWAGVPTTQFRLSPHLESGFAFREAHGIAENAIVLTYIGRIARDKGVETLVSAWQAFHAAWPAARLLVAGPLDETDAISAGALTNLREDPAVVLLEHFITDVPQLLAASDLFLQPSFREGLGVAALEASAMLLPVIAARVTGLTDAVRDEQTGVLFTAGDGHELAAAMLRLAGDAMLRAELGREGRRFVEAHFERGQVLAHGLQMHRRLVLRKAKRQPVLKRVLDVSIALTVLVLAVPLLAVTALAVLLVMGRPVFFKQRRAGLNGRPFELFKFRTMTAPGKGEKAYGNDAVRTPWLGELMRRMSLDELPQLLNVLRGDMSLVGPRPLLAEYLPRYSAAETRRHEVRPGITGWAQVNGRNAISWEKKFELDVWYVDHRSFLLDLKILLLTVQRVVRPAGVVPAGAVAMPEFLGHVQAEQM